MSSPPAKTKLLFHHDADLHKHETTILSIEPLASLSDSSKALFKLPEAEITPDLEIITCPCTIFHPQGGGQPSDEGTIISSALRDNHDGIPSHIRFQVLTARTDSAGQVLHLGRYLDTLVDDGINIPPAHPFQPGTSVIQQIDSDKRLLYSRLHTAGHILGAAVKHTVLPSIPSLTELKASHFPHSAACEFSGLIPGSFKDPIQAKVDEYVAASMPVEIEWWSEEDFVREGMEALIPDREVMGMDPGEKFRVVRIVGAEGYPCGGTHVGRSDGVGRVGVRKIGRSKGVSRVAYTVDGGARLKDG